MSMPETGENSQNSAMMVNFSLQNGGVAASEEAKGSTRPPRRRSHHPYPQRSASVGLRVRPPWLEAMDEDVAEILATENLFGAGWQTPRAPQGVERRMSGEETVLYGPLPPQGGAG